MENNGRKTGARFGVMRNASTTLLLFFLAVGCKSDSSAPDKKGAAAKSEGESGTSSAKKSKHSGKSSRARTPKWKVTYKGDVSGEVSGSILSVIEAGGIVAINGGAISKDPRDGKAEQELSVKVINRATGKAFVRLELPDGTECLDGQSSKHHSKIEVQDDNAKTYRATFSGDLNCGKGGATKISYEGTLNRRP